MKRNDIQGIRGVAILLVLFFHLQPSLFPLGFVGVDMFFVISGFLMMMILSKDSFSVTQLSNFYLRRFKRIVPLMHSIILFVYIVCFFILTEEDKKGLKTDLKWSLSFTSNIQPFFETLGYWDQVSAYRFLVHCWSLGVEIQFYLIAPFIIAYSNYLSSERRTIFLSIGIILSFVFQVFAPSKVSYDSLPARVWQFLLGCLSFADFEAPTLEKFEYEKLLQDDLNIVEIATTEEKPSQPVTTPEAASDSWISYLPEFCLFCFCFAVCFQWENNSIDQEIARSFACLIVSCALRWPLNPSKSFLSNGNLVYVGEVSYVMYLIHWPVIVMVKYLQGQHTLNFNTTIILFVSIFLLSVAFHHFLENNLLQYSLNVNFAISVFCLLLIFGSFPFYSSGPPPIGQNSSTIVTEAIKWNLANQEIQNSPELLPCKPDTTTEKWTNFTEDPVCRCEQTGSGTLNVLVIGNSIAMRTFPTIEKVFRGKYRNIRLYARSGAAPLTDEYPSYTAGTHIVVDRIRPDILWNIHGNGVTAKFIGPFENKTTDPIFLQFQEHMEFYSKRSKVFVIDLPLYWENFGMAAEFRKRLQTGQSFEDLRIPKNETVSQQLHHRKRLLSAKCENCIFNDVQPGTYEGDWYYLYNRKNLHQYTNDGWHFTSEMYERLEPIYQSMADKAVAIAKGAINNQN